jgi:16S rRNA A1518/A1519 N6-dimethyltransferase RsmA/KsgA/DIM1 with predicted DNA glycosylase/AP lyase activity
MEPQLDTIKQIMSTQLTELEVMIYLLVENGWSYRVIANLPFGISYTTVGNIYEVAKPKFERCAAAGFFQTEVK